MSLTTNLSSEKERESVSKNNGSNENQRQGSQSKDQGIPLHEMIESDSRPRGIASYDVLIGKRKEKHMLAATTTPTELSTDHGHGHRQDIGYRFWFGCEISITKLSLFRFVFYVLFAIDSWIQLSRSYKYDGDFQKFNVGHFHSLIPVTTPPSEEGPLNLTEWRSSVSWVVGRVLFPSRIAMEFGWLMRVFLSVRIAFGEAARWESVVLSLVTAYQYFISQIDNYQHHYLLVLICIILSTINWSALGARLEEQLANRRSIIRQKQSVKGKGKDKTSLLAQGEAITTTTLWQFRLLMVQLSVVYFWTSVAKMDSTWLSGND